MNGNENPEKDPNEDFADRIETLVTLGQDELSFTEELLPGWDLIEAEKAVPEEDNMFATHDSSYKSQDSNEESNLMKHARRELERVKLFDDDSDYGGMLGESVMELMEVFSRQGHSGYSAGMVVHIFTNLANFQPLSPLTDAPDEWVLVVEGDENTDALWQNNRKSDAFSSDGGKTYVVNGEEPGVVHTSLVIKAGE